MASDFEPEGEDVPGIPVEWLGPTGKVFVHPDGKTVSTEMVTTVNLDDKFFNIPLLVPGQRGINDLMSGKKPTKEQMDRAIKWSFEAGRLQDGFVSVESAVNAEKARHKVLDEKLMPLINDYLKTRKSRN